MAGMAAQLTEATEQLSPTESAATESKNELLRRQGWYLGEMTEETAASILMQCDQTNSFVVFCVAEGGAFILSMRYYLEGVDEHIIKHLPITCTEEGSYQLTGTTEVFPDVVEAVNSYVNSREPPLVAALGRGFETQISSTDAPPDYDKANRVLKTDVAPLPDIGSIRLEDMSEAKVGTLSPTSPTSGSRGYGQSRALPPRESHWHWYPELSRCHPKNSCHACCHRSAYLTGERNRTWYDPRGSGPLRIFGLIIFWALCGSCYGIYHVVLSKYVSCVTERS